MNIDIAVVAETATAAIRNRLNAIPICIAQEIDGIFAGLVFDHVEFEPPVITRVSEKVSIQYADGYWADVDGHHVRLYIPMKIYLVTRQELRTAGIAGAQSPIVLSLNLWYDLVGQLQWDNDEVIGAGIRTKYLGKSTELPDASLDAQVEATLKDAETFIPIDLGPLASALKKQQIHIYNIGVATPPDEGSIAIRIEVESRGFDPLADWSAFFTWPPDILGNRQWAILIDAGLLTSMAEAQFGAGLAKSSQLEVLEAPSALWLGFMGAPGMEITAYVDAVEACPNGLDIGVELTMLNLISLVSGPEKKQLQFSVTVSWNLIDSDVLLCGITMGTFSATLGAVLGGAAGPIGAAVGAVIGMVISIVGFAAGADIYEPETDSFQQQGCEEVYSDDDHVVLKCMQPFDLGSNELTGLLNPDELLGHPNGLLLRGSATVPALKKKLIVHVTPMGWDSHLNCGTRNVETTHTGSVGLTAFGAGNLEVCHLEIVDDKLAINGQPGYFMIETIHRDLRNRILRINTNNALQEAYSADPYPCHIMVRTSHGARFLDLGVQPPPPPPPPDPHKWKFEILRECLEATEKFSQGIRLNPKWRIDPPPDKEIVQHWEVVAVGLEPGDTLELLDSADHVLASVPVWAGGVARAQAVVTLQQGQLSIVRKISAGSASRTKFNPDLHRLAITQRLLVLERRVALSGIAREMVLFQGAGLRQLAVLTDTGVHVWAPRSLGTIGATLHLLDDEISYICGLEGGVAVFGSDSLRYLEARNDGQLHITTRPALRNIIDVTVVGRSVAILTRDRLFLLDGRLKVKAEVPMRGAIGVGTVAGRLAVRLGQGESVSIYEVTHQQELRPGPTINVPASARLGGKSVRLSTSMHLTKTNRDKVDMTGGTGPAMEPDNSDMRIIGRRIGSDKWPELRIERTGWIHEAVRFGSLLARIEAGGRQLALYRFTKTLSV